MSPAEPACINNPTNCELITDRESIKAIEHCAKILAKNKIRDCDKEELRTKEEEHTRIMENREKERNGYEL